MEAFPDFLERWLSEARMSPSRLSERSGVPASIISRWLARARASRPSPKNLEKLAPVLGVSYEDLMRVCGYLPADPEMMPRVPIPVRQRSLDLEYDRWMAVMAPRMGEQEADRAFWEPLIRNARTRREDVEAALSAAESADVSDVVQPLQLKTGEQGSDDADSRVLTAASLIVVPRR